MICQTKAHLPFLPEQYLQMREDKKLLFVFSTSLDQLVEGDDQLLTIDSVRDHQSSYYRREGSFTKKAILLLEELPVDRSLQNRKTIILLSLRSLLDLSNSGHDGYLSLKLLHIQFLISLKALLEVIGRAKQGEIFVVLFNHEFLEHLLLALHGLLEGLPCPLTHYIPPNHIERAIVISWMSYSTAQLCPRTAYLFNDCFWEVLGLCLATTFTRGCLKRDRTDFLTETVISAIFGRRRAWYIASCYRSL